MSSDPEQNEQPGPEETAPEARDLQDLVLNLNFVPTWARQPATQNPYEHARGEDRPRREDRERRRDGPPGRDRRDRRPPSGRDRRGPPDGRSFPRRDRERPDAPREERLRLPLDVSFIPERLRLSAVVKQLHHSKRAYPLMYLAHIFLGKPDYHLVKLELHTQGGRSDFRLYQCAEDKVVFLAREDLQAHCLAKFLERVYEAQDVQVDPPAGNFTCVGRCRLSGSLIGPPNYHGYNEKLLELYRSRFLHLSLDAYRNQVEQVKDPAVIEQWKDQCRTQRVYKVREQADAPPMKRAEAEAHFLAHHWPRLLQVTNRCFVTAAALAEMPDGPLRQTIRDTWNRESRFPFKMSLALRPAFKRMRLHLFKAGKGETYVTAVPPKPIDAAHTIEGIRSMLVLLQEHPGWTRQQLVEHLLPGVAMDAEPAAQALSPLRWLIEKGHVIEFFNGTLALPASHRREIPEKAADTSQAVGPAPTETIDLPASPQLPEAPASSTPG